MGNIRGFEIFSDLKAAGIPVSPDLLRAIEIMRPIIIANTTKSLLEMAEEVDRKAVQTMGNLKRWRQVGGNTDANFMKWETENQELEGSWVGVHDGKYGPVGTIETEEGKVSFALHTVLLDKLTDMKPGTIVKVIYLGKARGKKGTEYKDFAVYVSVEPVNAPEDEDPDEDLDF